MGLLFLLPVIYLVVHVKRSQAFAAAVAAKKARLLWYIERLDSGESSAKQARMDMSKALRAVSELEWIDGLEAWGPKRLEHRTEDIALAVWSVDPRLATVNEGWPIVVGVHVLNGTWDLAALRFDAPEGQGLRLRTLNRGSSSRERKCSSTRWAPVIGPTLSWNWWGQRSVSTLNSTGA